MSDFASNLYFPHLLPLLSSNFFCLIQLIGPYALGVLPKANFFAELVQSMDDNPMKPIDISTNSSPALAMTQPKNSYKVKESGSGMVSNHLYISSFYYVLKCFFSLSLLLGTRCDDPSLPLVSVVIAESRVRGSHLTPASTDKSKKERSSTIPRRPDSSFRSSIQSSTPMRRMRLVDSPSTNSKTVERNFGSKDVSLTSHTRIANNSSTAKKGNLTESASVKDIYTTSQAVSAPVIVPRDILEDKTVSSVSRGTGGTTTPDAFRVPVHRRKPSLSGTAADSDSSVGSILMEPDVCSEGLPSLKFSFGISPYSEKEEYSEVDKKDIAQIAEKMDKTVSLEHPLQSYDDKCIALLLCSQILTLLFF